jgi:hypothetical protein
MKTTVIPAFLCLLMASIAHASEGVQVKITNDGTQDIMVTVYDRNAATGHIVMQGIRINGFTSVPLTVVADASGKANLSWTAIGADTASPKCGYGDVLGIADDSSLSVHVDAGCDA